jgi:hypothetical protein
MIAEVTIMIDYVYDGETVRLSDNTSDQYAYDETTREEVLADAQIFADSTGSCVKILSSGGEVLAAVTPAEVPS